MPHEAVDPEAPASVDTKPNRTPDLIGRVLGDWETNGPLVHEPTGIARLDELTGGGPVYGTRWVLAGQPDSGKTALMIQIGHEFALRNISVGLMAVDEEPDDIVTRLAQRAGFTRQDCEKRDPSCLANMRSRLSALPIYFYDATWTIETAASDLAIRARATGGKAMLGVDSLQTVRCTAEATQREMSEISAVTARMHALRSVASRHQLIALATSEVGRSNYDGSRQSTALPSAKWSGAVEYSARVLIALRSVPGETDLVELELGKNKHGPRDQKLHLRIDRSSQTLTTAARESRPADSSSRDARALERVWTDAEAVAKALIAKPGSTVRGLRAAVRASTGVGNDRVDAGVQILGAAVVRSKGPRGATPMSLDLAALPPRIREALRSTD